MSESGYLTNQLLIAMPTMGDPNFSQTVALVCDHNARGALGLILNKPLSMRMGEIFEQFEIELPGGPLRERQVLRGGPMQTDRGFVVHRAGGEWDSTLKVSDTIHVTTSRDISGRHGSRPGPEEAMIALGYAGWDGGQLEEEIRANAWLSAPVDSGIIFELPSNRVGRPAAAAGRGAVAHQPDQRQCLSRKRLRRPHPSRPPAATRRGSAVFSPSIFGRNASGPRAATPLSRTASRWARSSSGAAGPRWEAIDALMRDWQPALIVVGLPYNVDGSESALTAAADVRG